MSEWSKMKHYSREFTRRVTDDGVPSWMLVLLQIIEEPGKSLKDIWPNMKLFPWRSQFSAIEVNMNPMQKRSFAAVL